MWPAEQADVPVRPIHHIQKSARAASAPENRRLPNTPAERRTTAESQCEPGSIIDPGSTDALHWYSTSKDNSIFYHILLVSHV